MESNCAHHSDAPAVATCKACEKKICLMCVVDVQGDSFCSDSCSKAYQEVRDWLERPAAAEEWNPLAPAEAAPVRRAEPPAPPPSRAPAPPPPRVTKTPSPAGPVFFAPTEPEPEPEPEPARSGSGKAALFIGIAAAAAVVAGFFVIQILKMQEEPPAVVQAPPAKPKPRPLPPTPKPQGIVTDPSIKPEVARPEPAVSRVEPVKPPVSRVEPPAVEPPKPPPKPAVSPVEPPKPVKPPVEPPKPAVSRVEPPAVSRVEPPAVSRVEPATKVEPPKPEPPKPAVSRVEPPAVSRVKPPPPPPPAPRPESLPHLAFLHDPWGQERVGAWYRLRTTLGVQETYLDIGLGDTGPGFRVVLSQSSAPGEPERFRWVEPLELTLGGALERSIGGTLLRVDVVETKSPAGTQHVIKDGPHAGIAIPGEGKILRLGSQSVTVKGREFACTLIETESAEPGKVTRQWISRHFPPAMIKTENVTSRTELIDFGPDWSMRPPFPAPPAPVIARVDPPKPAVSRVEPPAVSRVEPPKPEPPKPPPAPPKPEPAPVKPEPPKPAVSRVEPPEPPKPEPVPVKPEPPKPAVSRVEPQEPPKPEDPAARTRQVLLDASRLIREATPLYQEIMESLEPVPDDLGTVQELLKKAEEARRRMVDARLLYTTVKDDAPDPGLIERRIVQLNELLDSIKICMQKLREKAR